MKDITVLLPVPSVEPWVSFCWIKQGLASTQGLWLFILYYAFVAYKDQSHFKGFPG